MNPSDVAKEFLSSVLPDFSTFTSTADRPFVTLTYAQSLDGKIAGKGGKQLILSGKESMIMTHWMRTMHDGILIGIGTALNDDPQLNTRHLPPSEIPYPQPQPIILDSSCRLPVTCKLVRNYQAGKGKKPWILCAKNSSPQMASRMQALTEAGVDVITISSIKESSKLDVEEVLRVLHSLSIRSLMVEGGQRIISSFISHRPDLLIVTLAPMLVGSNGVGVFGDDDADAPKIQQIRSLPLGRDMVFCYNILGT